MTNHSVVSLRQKPDRSRGRAVCLGVAFLIALSGCTRVKVKLGLKVDLDKTPVDSIEAKLPKGPGIAPGEKSPLVAVFTGPGGKVLTTEGEGHGKVPWKDLKVTASVVTVNEKGILTLPRDPRISDGKAAHVAITVPSHPGLHAELDIPVRYDRNYTADFSGGNGFDGSNGLDGRDGLSGSMGSMDPDHPVAGGDGSNGTNGDDGKDGESGGNAPPVQIRVALRSGSHPLLQVSVTAAGHQQFYLVDPQGGSLMVRADGGAGGSGGMGGRGGRGGSGGMGSPSGRNGLDGTSGLRGRDGWPGKGGSITVTYDPSAKPFLGAIRLSSLRGPRPVFTEEPVGPLW
ncbi:MAG TPA: hypothetical protein VJX67_02465 [Blastocatellia bacterium]|nr:hypothetical protein [Blastocatellia bacterium]